MSPEKYYANLSDDALILAASQEIRDEAVLMDNAVMREIFADLPVTYVIFITQRDIWKKRLPLYTIDRIIGELDAPFDDGAHIIYVNASYKGNDAIGRLMQDFHCPAPNKMHYPLLAERMRNLKGDEVKMGSAIEELKRRSKDQGKLDGMLQSSLDTAKKLKQLNKMSIEEIAEVTNLTLEQVKAIPT